MHTPTAKPLVGISACLLGERVRYNGEHKWSDNCQRYLAPYVNFHPICPETAIGLPTPRPPMDLFETAEGIQVRGKTDPELNPTAQLRDYANRISDKLSLDGYVLMPRSPSCGLSSSKIYRDGVLTHSTGAGVFARQLQTQCPELLMLEEPNLADPDMRLAFLCGIYLQQAWRRAQLNSNPPEHFYRQYGYVLAAINSVHSGEPSCSLQIQQGATIETAAYAAQLQLSLRRWLARPIQLASWTRSALKLLHAEHPQSAAGDYADVPVAELEQGHTQSTDAYLQLLLAHLAALQQQSPANPQPLPFLAALTTENHLRQPN